MADHSGRGRLLAIDGADSKVLTRAASALQHRFERQGTPVLISRWDASGLFTDVVTAPPEERQVSARTLLLLYAADLAFRVRWEIRPALDEGQIVIAAPYVATAIAFGEATGLSRKWLDAVLDFAPVPTHTAALKEPSERRVWRPDPERGFGEACTTLLATSPHGFRQKRTRRAMVAALTRMAKRRGGLLRPREVRALVSTILE